MIAVMYVLIRSVGGKFQVAFPSPAGTGFGVGELETTSQWSGAVTVKVKIDFRSGCSNAARSEERRVGKEGTSGELREACNKKIKTTSQEGEVTARICA